MGKLNLVIRYRRRYRQPYNSQHLETAVPRRFFACSPRFPIRPGTAGSKRIRSLFPEKPELSQRPDLSENSRKSLEIQNITFWSIYPEKPDFRRENHEVPLG